ncbi:MAG: NAD(P)/FAD-dependent oxidoreductase [Clostridiales bacterium]|nr:NAD(P)/FAD-dependent oxidoreductase [Clostridiales bacterium]
MKKYQVVIIGGGASGMVAAIEAAKRGYRTAILEHKDRLGKKILATGNGKCNYTNLYQTKDCYRGSHPEFGYHIIKKFDEKQTIKYFEAMGILPKVRNGYVYPNSEQAASVADVLAMECRRYGIDIHLNEHVADVKKKNDKFLINSGYYEAENVILAAGGCAAPKQGSDGSGFVIAKALGHTIKNPFPALVQLKAKEKYGKTISGVRCEAKGTLMLHGREVVSETGEFLLTDYGISGIPVFQMSRFANELVEEGLTPCLYLDLFPTITEVELIVMLKHRFSNSFYKTIEETMVGMLNHKLSYLLLKEAKIAFDGMSKNMREKDFYNLARLMKQMPFTIIGSNGFDQAQVSAGGVNTDEIDPETLESKLVKGLYLTGEVVDVDGTCGGYNLQWAWSSGVIAGRSVVCNTK